MFVLPVLVLVFAGLAVYSLAHHRPQPATGTVDTPALDATHRSGFWPTTIAGKLAVGTFAASFVPMVLVNLIQVPYLGAVLLPAALALAAVARFAKHDRAMSVLITLVVSAVAVLFALLFVAGEVFIGHE